MKRMSLLAFLLVMSVAVAAQTPMKQRKPMPTGTAGRAADEAALIEIEKAFPEAMMKRDVSMFERVAAEDLTDIAPDGTINTKAKDIEDLKSGTFSVESASVSDLKPRIYGDMAVVTGVADMKGKYKDQDITGRYRFTDTFVRRNGEWKLVATQTTKIMEQEMK